MSNPAVYKLLCKLRKLFMFDITSSTSGKSSGSMVRAIVCRLALVMNCRLPDVGSMSAEGSFPGHIESGERERE